ncbi:histone-lysine N-methyltransferase SETMAR [Elysia marginata]|uniref:Histone-lysine N-methyltransferase SETMAR n=1 Tax=Elysia marginata TaxID=1093978 RepID=A0AAV4IHY3_9GAST|nr:histone-lysine N-methyltransferase SETMAR [Elysia marginata]
MSRSRVQQWCTWFGEGRTSLDDEPKSGRPKTSTNEENTTLVGELIKCDKRMKIREIALKLEIPMRIRPSEIYRKIAETYSEGAMSRSRVQQWCTWFGEGRTSLDDEPKSGRPKTSTNEESTTLVDELIKCDKRMKIREIALKLEIPMSMVHEIVHDTLG